MLEQNKMMSECSAQGSDGNNERWRWTVGVCGRDKPETKCLCEFWIGSSCQRAKGIAETERLLKAESKASKRGH